MICTDCGREAPLRDVAFHQNIGALVVRFSRTVRGRLCKSCIHRHFWSTTGTTLALGWWGTISFLVTPFFLLNNIGRYAVLVWMPGVPQGARAPVLTEDAARRIGQLGEELFGRLDRGEQLRSVAQSVADRVGVTPGQVALFVREVVRRQQAVGDTARS